MTHHCSMEYPTDRPLVKLAQLRIKKKSLKIAIYENENTFDLYIGGPAIYCIHALIHKPTSVFVQHGITLLSNGTITTVLYNIECSLEHNFQKGVDTTGIIRLLMAYIKKHFPYIKTLSFNDASHKPCDNGHVVELSEMNYIRTGITWYQKHFHAYLNEQDLARFLVATTKFQALKSLFTWAQMKSIMTTYNGLEIEEGVVRSMFEKAATWQDFFGPLSDRIGISEFCGFVAPWLHAFLIHSLRFNFAGPLYIIPLDLNLDLDYEETAFAQGGRRFTRKQLKTRPLSIME